MDVQLSEYMDVIQKQNEGLLLALQAGSEVMNRLDSRLEKMEHNDDEAHAEEESRKEAEEMEMVKSNLIKEAALAAVQLMKKDNVELNGDTFHKVSHKDVFNNGVNDDDPVSPELTTATSEVQKPLQAMLKSMSAEQYKMLQKHFLKEHASLYESDKMEDLGDEIDSDVKEDVLEAEDDLGMDEDFTKDMHVEEDVDMDSADYPMEEEDYEKMYKSLKKNFNVEVRKMAEATLKKQGWNKEISRAPRRISKSTLGADKNNVLKKSKDNAMAELKEFSDRSWNELCRDYAPVLQSATMSPMDDDLLEFYS